MTALERFSAKYVVASSTGCWLWAARVQANGYGQFRMPDGQTLAHRASYRLFRGAIPKGLTIDHLCRVRRCVNPWHLEVVSYRENILRGETRAAANAAKQECPRGHPYAGENLRWNSDGGRVCKICQAVSEKRYRERHAPRMAVLGIPWR